MVAGQRQLARQQVSPGEEEDVLSSKKPSQVGRLVTCHLFTLSGAGGPLVPVFGNLTNNLKAKKRLIATHPNSRIAPTNSNQRTSLFQIAALNGFPKTPLKPAGRQRYIKQKDKHQILIDRMPIRNRCNSLKTNDGDDF
jgi:hypothetical protein